MEKPEDFAYARFGFIYFHIYHNTDLQKKEQKLQRKTGKNNYVLRGNKANAERIRQATFAEDSAGILLSLML